MSNSLRPHGLQHARLPCPSPSPGVGSNACPLSQWCHPTILSSVVPFSSCLMIFPNIRVFSGESALCIRWPKYWSFSISIGPSNEYSGLIPLGWTGLILLSIVWCINVFPTNRHPCTLEWISLTSFVMFGGMPHWWQDLSSQTRDRTQALAVRAQTPNPWITREFQTLTCS